MGKELYNGGIFGGRSREEVYNRLVNTWVCVPELMGIVHYRGKKEDEETRVEGHFEIKIRKDLIDRNDPDSVLYSCIKCVHAIAVGFGIEFKDDDMCYASLCFEGLHEVYDICKFSNSYYSFFGKLSFDEFIKSVSDFDKEIKSGRIGVIDPIVKSSVIRPDQLSDEDVKEFIDRLAYDMLYNRVFKSKDFLLFSNRILSLYAKIDAGTISLDVRGVQTRRGESFRFKKCIFSLWYSIRDIFKGSDVAFGFCIPGNTKLNRLIDELGKYYGRTEFGDNEVYCKSDPIRVSEGTKAPKELETFFRVYDHPDILVRL